MPKKFAPKNIGNKKKPRRSVTTLPTRSARKVGGKVTKKGNSRVTRRSY